MFRSEIYKELFPVEEKKEEAQLTPSELQRVVMELSRRVAKLERHMQSSS